MDKKKYGFTLAEVLITLGIIGVVAALTIPSLMANYRKSVVANKLKETYSILKQAERLAMNDDNGPDAWNFKDDGAYSNSIIEKFIPYLTNITYCKYNTSKHPKIVTGDGQMSIYTMWVQKSICIPNGAMIFASSYGSNGRVSGINIYVDINGDALPNVFGKDVFEMYIQNPSLNDRYYATYCPAELSLCPRSGVGKRFTGDRQELLKMCATQGGNSGSNSCGVIIKDSGWAIPSDYPVRFW